MPRRLLEARREPLADVAVESAQVTAPAPGRILQIPALPTVAAGLTAAAFLGWHIRTPSLWFHEATTATVIDRSMRDIHRYTGLHDRILEPYYLLMHVWTSLAGSSELALRLPSLLGCIAAVGVTVALARRWTSGAGWVCAAGILILMPAVSRYAQEARPYGLALGASTAVVLLLERALERPRWHRSIGYAVAVALTGLLHVVSLLVLVVTLAQIAVRKRELRSWLLATTAGVAAPLGLAF